jgi:hypothetical protein
MTNCYANVKLSYRDSDGFIDAVRFNYSWNPINTNMVNLNLSSSFIIFSTTLIILIQFLFTKFYISFLCRSQLHFIIITNFYNLVYYFELLIFTLKSLLHFNMELPFSSSTFCSSRLICCLLCLVCITSLRS